MTGAGPRLLGECASTADIEPGPWPNRFRPQQRSTLCTRSVPGGPAPYGSGAQSDRPSQPGGVARQPGSRVAASQRRGWRSGVGWDGVGPSGEVTQAPPRHGAVSVMRARPIVRCGYTGVGVPGAPTDDRTAATPGMPAGSSGAGWRGVWSSRLPGIGQFRLPRSGVQTSGPWPVSSRRPQAGTPPRRCCSGARPGSAARRRRRRTRLDPPDTSVYGVRFRLGDAD